MYLLLSRMVMDTIKALDIDLIRPMYANIVLAGGTTLLPGFADRLRHELHRTAPSSVVVNIIEPPNRHLSSWIGSIKHNVQALYL
jgi:centractin